MIYFVATPIGNLADISLRALETLKSVDIIACEDTRTSQKLLNHYQISKQLIAHHKHNEKSSAEGIIALAKQGKSVAIISDGGMPLISDPGEALSARLKEEQLPFTVIPGANAALSALVLSGLSASRFCFIGFLPEKQKEKKEVLVQYKNILSTLIFHISPHNLEKDLQFLFQELGKRKACLVKEISKIHEQSHSFYLGDTIQMDMRGEFVLVVEGCINVLNPNHKNILQEIDALTKAGISQSDCIKMVAKRTGLSKNEVYKIALKEEKKV